MRTLIGPSSCLAALLASLFLAAGVGAARAEMLTVFAAASLKGALDEVAAAWAAETGHEARLAFAGSSELARQIRHGAPADVVISANAFWMDALAAEGLISEETRIDLLGNRLVLIAPADEAAPLPLEPGPILDRLAGRPLAMALVDAVPAGLYGRAALQSLGAWDAVAPRVVQADNVRTALAYVARGEAALGLVYATDAKAEDGVAVVADIPRSSHPPVVYPAAVVSSGDVPLATAFLTFLRGPASREAFRRWGFAVIGA